MVLTNRSIISTSLEVLFQKEIHQRREPHRLYTSVPLYTGMAGMVRVSTNVPSLSLIEPTLHDTRVSTAEVSID